MENLYKILHCHENATQEELKSKYQELILKYHPDKSGRHNDTTEIFVKINKAWNILGDPKVREQFDLRWNERCLANSWPIQEIVDITEFTALVSDTERQTEDDMNLEKYSYNCRCGGQFLLSSSDIELKFDIVCCDSCSLAIQVIYEDGT